MRWVITPVVLFSLLSPALAQQAYVLQSGTVTPNHITMWTTNGVVQDAGSATQGFLSALGVTASGNGICQNSGPTSGPYQQLCFGVTSSGGTITFGGQNGAPVGTFNAIVNGNTYQFPFTPPATAVQGPNPSTVGNIGCWANGVGTLLANCGLNSSLLYSAPNYGINTANTNLWTSDNQEFSNNNGRTVIISTPSTGQQGCISYWDGLRGGAGGGTQKWQLCKQPGQDFLLGDIAGNRNVFDAASNGNLKIMPGGGGTQFGSVNATPPTGGVVIGGNSIFGGGTVTADPWIDVTSGANGCNAADPTGSSAADGPIQCQINWIESNVGAGVIFFPCGNFKITNTLLIQKREDLVGSGLFCTTLDTHGADLTAVKFRNSTSQTGSGGLHNLYVSGDQNTSATANLVEIYNYVNATFERLQLVGGNFALKVDGSPNDAPGGGGDNYFINVGLQGWGTNGGCLWEFETGNWFIGLRADQGAANTKDAIKISSDGSGNGAMESTFVRVDMSGSFTNSLEVSATASREIYASFYHAVVSAAVVIGTARWISFVGSELSNSTTISDGSTPITITGSMANSLATVSGGIQSCSANYQIVCAPYKTRTSASPTNPNGTTSNTGVMAGLAGSFTPKETTGAMYSISATAANATAGDGCIVTLRYGTGGAPANGNALTGSLAGNSNGQTMTSSGAGQFEPISMVAYISGLVAGTTYWLDVGEAAITGGAGHTCSLYNIALTAIEQ